MDKEIEIQAAVFRRLLKHLDNRKDVQNIELMNLAGFCRNCFSKWFCFLIFIPQTFCQGVRRGATRNQHVRGT